MPLSSTKIHLTKATFTNSAPDIRRLPKDSGIEVAFAGRSNAGKSSALNTLTNQRGLARISKTPGRTQLINVFEVAENRRLVDLPGYGFARKSKKEKKIIEEIITDYFLNRNHINLTFVLIYLRLKPQKIDLEFMLWLNQNNLQFKIIFTKADKLNKKEFIENPDNYLKILYNEIGIHPEHFVSSSKSKLGREEILHNISLQMNSKRA